MRPCILLNRGRQATTVNANHLLFVQLLDGANHGLAGILVLYEIARVLPEFVHAFEAG